MEIERKYLIDKLPFNLTDYPCHEIEQAYLNTEPVVRIRRQDDSYYLTYKSKGLMAREEYNLPLDAASYEHLLEKADGNILTKTRYEIPLGDHLTIEIDVFHGKFSGLILAEVEFPNLEEAESFQPPEYFGKDVTFSTEYHNSTLSRKVL
ncbi:MAG: CYTH domain-containing protein [Clostridia bacterium]|nr:CYTH domain-containing protein [Lachnospiraceae bacterium]NCB99766.1 CYTH domain-containing protein [Clostridia bacterium]NCD03893.1 CYTH domain-containing protein [Clostridia bacterium]